MKADDDKNKKEQEVTFHVSASETTDCDMDCYRRPHMTCLDKLLNVDFLLLRVHIAACKHKVFGDNADRSG